MAVSSTFYKFSLLEEKLKGNLRFPVGHWMLVWLSRVYCSSLEEQQDLEKLTAFHRIYLGKLLLFSLAATDLLKIKRFKGLIFS